MENKKNILKMAKKNKILVPDSNSNSNFYPFYIVKQVH